MIPECYDRDQDGVPRKWIDRVRACMAPLTSHFNSNRMMREYVEYAYLPAAEAYRTRMANDAGLAKDWRSGRTPFGKTGRDYGLAISELCLSGERILKITQELLNNRGNDYTFCYTAPRPRLLPHL